MTMNESTEYKWAAEPYRWLCIAQFVSDPGFPNFKLKDPKTYDTLAEIADMKKLIGERAKRQSSIESQATDVVSPFAAAVPFTSLQHGTVHELATTLKELGRYLVMYYKGKFNRVRPSDVDTTLITVIAVPGHPAYPSGHALQSHLIAHALSSLFPDAERTLFAVAQEISFNRQVAGVHYQSDTDAGKELAQQAWPLISNPKICPAIDVLVRRARAELKAHPV